jgi:hypothetical protein
LETVGPENETTRHLVLPRWQLNVKRERGVLSGAIESSRMDGHFVAAAASELSNRTMRLAHSALKIEQQQRFIAWLAGSQEDVVLRESEALMALLRSDVSLRPWSLEIAKPTSHMADAATPQPPTAMVEVLEGGGSSSSSSQAELTADAATGAQRPTEALRHELSALVSDAALPVGSALCEFVDDFRDMYGQVAAAPAERASAPSAVPAAPSSSLWPLPLPSLQLLQQLPQRLWWRSRADHAPAEGAPPPLQQVVTRVHEVLTALEGLLDEHLPLSLREDPRAVGEGRRQLAGQLHRSIYAVLSPLYAAAQATEISALAQSSHHMRSLLPCDLQLPPPLWLVEPGDPSAVALRDCGPSDPRLPYAIAVQLLRTLTFYRTPEEKAKVLLEACTPDGL